MAAAKNKNNAYSTLAGSLTTTATTLTVAAGHGDRFPVVTGSDWAIITLQNAANAIEILKITARASASDSMTVVRAQEGTGTTPDVTGLAWALGDLVELRPTAGTMATVDGTQTLTNKTIDLADNTLVGVAASGANADITSLTALTPGGLPNSSVLTADIADSNVTQAKLAAAVVPLGVGQTRQDVLASRAAATTYTNATGRPIQVYVTVQSSVEGSQLVLAPTCGSGPSEPTETQSVWRGALPETAILSANFLVLAGEAYRVDVTNGILTDWTEIR